MSYLNAPRLVFAGQFQADPSTVNNDPQHFDTADFRSNYQMPGPGASNGWWNPTGSGAWRFRDCTVQSVVYSDGTTCDDPNIDPVVGSQVNDARARVEGKLVDLDPEQQMVSQVWGFRVMVGQPPGVPAALPSPGFGFVGEFRVAPFADIWMRYPQGQPDSFFGAFYQSTLDSVEWSGAGPSRFLKELQETGDSTRLSIRFNVDGYNDDSTSPDFTFGRVVGSIGPYTPGQPAHFVAGRQLVSTAPPQPFSTYAYAQLDGELLAIDLGNCLQTQSVGGPLVNVGRLYAALLPATGAPVLLGEINYQDAGWYEATAGVVSFKLTPDQAKQAAETPLGVVQWNSGSFPQGFVPMLAENTPWMRADNFVYRLNPGETKDVTFYATNLGAPYANQQISLAYDASQMAGQVQQGALSGPGPVGEPTTALTFPTSVNTGADGTATVTLTASDPGNLRRYIDGQVYGVTYALGAQAPPYGSVSNPSASINALVFSGYEAPKQPDWLCDVAPIFQQYANLYPVMRPIVDLADYASVVSRRSLLLNVFSTDESDPNYMPVTRDLSKAKREMLVQWLSGEPPLYMSLDSVGDLTTALQQAIELEHSTIPPYLTAYYSIKQGTNVEAAELIRSIVIEEMLHMALVCNILVSIGGSPAIGQPGFVPRYPGPLPGGLRGGLTVRLRRCSIAQVRDVFMSIEEPSETVDPVRLRDAPFDPHQIHPYTIGWFYDELKRSLTALNGSGAITFGNADKQVRDWTGTGKLYVIESLEDAVAAIDEIKRQGEGATPTDPDDGDKELAHYYKFAEIVYGRRIVVTPEGYSYTGAHVPFDPEGVWPMMDDPDLALLPKGSRAALLSEQFAETYQSLLAGLNRAFNGDPGYIGQAIGIMYSLSVIARQLMQTPSGLPDGTTAGPSFQLPVPF